MSPLGEKSMREYVGLWIDNAGALVVSLREDECTVQRIESLVEGRFRLSGGSRSATPYGPQDVASDTRAEERRGHQLRRYYRQIITAIHGADAILLLGPGEAKLHLAKEIRRDKALARKLRSVEAADKMTERQFIARVKEFFAPGSTRRQ
jgi:hypothetical protein